MDNYSKLLIDNDKMINGKIFTYNLKTGEFKFEVTPKYLEMDVLKNFRPKANDNDDFKSRLENEIYKLSISSGEYRFESSLYSKNKGLRYYSVNIKNSESEPNIIDGVIYDITNQKNLLSKMAQAEKLRSIGEIASGIAHDFNNHLMVITGSCELLELQDLTDKQKKTLEKMKQEGKKNFKKHHQKRHKCPCKNKK